MYEFTDRDDNTIATALAALVLIGSILAVAFVAPVAAADVEVHNATVTVDANTDTVWAEVNNTNATTQANVSITFTAIDNGTETELSTVWANTSADSTQLVESQAINGTANDSVRVVADVYNSSVPAENVTVTSGTFQQVSGGSGSAGLGGTGIGLGAAALLVGAALLMRRSDG